MDERQAVMNEVRALMDQYRARCLWSVRVDYYPESLPEAVRMLEAIERSGDATAFQKARALREWLSRISNVASASS